MIIDYKDYISSNNILINNDENINDDDDLLDIYNTENYLNNDILNNGNHMNLKIRMKIL